VNNRVGSSPTLGTKYRSLLFEQGFLFYQTL